MKKAMSFPECSEFFHLVEKHTCETYISDFSSSKCSINNVKIYLKVRRVAMKKSTTIVRSVQNHPNCIWNVLTNTMRYSII